MARIDRQRSRDKVETRYRAMAALHKADPEAFVCMINTTFRESQADTLKAAGGDLERFIIWNAWQPEAIARVMHKIASLTKQGCPIRMVVID